MTTALCPRCNDEITVPSRGRPESRVQCPLCLEEMRLEEVLSSVPPMLILLDEADQYEATPAPSKGWSTSASDDAAYEVAGAGSGGHEFLGGGIGAATTTMGAPSASIATGPMRVKKQPNIVAEILKVIVGGVVGITLAVMVLWWLPEGYGQTDILGIGPTIAKYVPQIVPPKFRGETPAGGDGKTSNTNGGNDNEIAMNNNPGKTPGRTLPMPDITPRPTPTPSDPTVLPPDPTDPLNVIDPLTTPPDPDDPLMVKDPLDTPDPTPEPTPESTPEPTPTPDPTPEPTPPADQAADIAKLADTITAAQEAVTAFETADPADVANRRKLGTELFEAAARVGVAAAKLDQRDSAAAEVLDSLPAYMKSISDTPGKVSMLGFLASQRLDSPGEESGIACVGIVKDIRAAGKAFEVQLELTTKDKRPMIIVVKENPQDVAKVEQKVLVAGTVTDDAAKQVKGYEGAQGIVIVAGHLQLVE